MIFLFNNKYCLYLVLSLILNPDTQYLVKIPDYRLVRKINPDKTFPNPPESGLTRVDCN